MPVKKSHNKVKVSLTKFSPGCSLNVVEMSTTLGLHQIHHHYQNPYTDSNYGDVLSIWDRMFGTLKRMPSDKVVFGIDTYMRDKEEDNSFFSIFKIPFSFLKKANKTETEKLPDS